MPHSLRVWPCLAVLAVAGCGLFPREEKTLAPPLLTTPEVTYDVVEVKKGTIEHSVSASATFSPYEQSNLTFRFRSGRLRTLTVSPGDQVKQGALVAELDTGSLESRIAQQRLLVRKYELLAERATALGRDRYERELAALDVEIAKLQLADLEQELQQSRLYAPLSGVVVYVTRISEGDPVAAWQTVAQIADPKRLQLVYQGDRASDFALGMKVTVRYRDRSYTGEVVQCPGSLPPDVPEELRDAVVVRMPALPPGAERGNFATLSVVFERRVGVVVIPRDVVRMYLGRSFVQVMEDGIKKERTIEIGMQTTTEVEVVKGLAPGEQVVSP